MLCLHINLSIQPLKAEKLATSRWAEICRPFSLRWVPSVEALLEHAWTVQQMQIPVLQWRKFQWLLLLRGRSTLDETCFSFFTVFAVGFSVGTEILNRDACSIHVSISAWTCAKIFILITCYLGVPLLSMFHLIAVKFILVYNKIWSLWNEVTWAQENWMI
jgi:hypothetical protein